MYLGILFFIGCIALVSVVATIMLKNNDDFMKRIISKIVTSFMIMFLAVVALAMNKNDGVELCNIMVFMGLFFMIVGDIMLTLKDLYKQSFNSAYVVWSKAIAGFCFAIAIFQFISFVWWCVLICSVGLTLVLYLSQRERFKKFNQINLALLLYSVFLGFNLGHLIGDMIFCGISKLNVIFFVCFILLALADYILVDCISKEDESSPTRIFASSVYYASQIGLAFILYFVVFV